ncbi:MAG TPA: AAA family ATPase [Verrucomicrobiae bacterium]|nr:AAA family ATPase [Verrucomicrobiae bacterium]
MNELSARCAGKFIPKSIEDFIGTNRVERTKSILDGAKSIAVHLEKAVRLSRQNENAPIKFLFNGVPGIGKSDLARYLQFLTGCDQWSTTKLNGTTCKIEKVEEIARSLQYKTLFGDYRMLWIDEADEIPRLAQVRFLTLLDDSPAGVVVVCTSNCTLSSFENRFQTRFQVFEVAAPPIADIEKLIIRLAPEIPARDAMQIANFAGGNVRQALLDAQGLLQAAA